MARLKFNRTVKRGTYNHHYLLFDSGELGDFVDGKKKRVVLTIGNVQLHRALMPQKPSSYTVMIGKSDMKKAGLHAGMEAEVELYPDDSEYQFEMPESLQEVLLSDPEAADLFEKLTPGRQRGIMHTIGKVKSVDLQIDKALRLCENLKRGVTDMRQIFK